jgi:ribose 5-phosphate isomerase B
MASSTTSVIIGCDHAAYRLKTQIAAHMTANGYVLEDVGVYNETSVDYPDIGVRVAAAVSLGAYPRGILLCGTGIGMSMVANRLPDVRAALCGDLFSAIMSRRHNNANILVLGGRIIGDDLAMAIVDAWLNTGFDAGRHQRRLEKFARLEDMPLES